MVTALATASVFVLDCLGFGASLEFHRNSGQPLSLRFGLGLGPAPRPGPVARRSGPRKGGPRRAPAGGTRNQPYPVAQFCPDFSVTEASPLDGPRAALQAQPSKHDVAVSFSCSHRWQSGSGSQGMPDKRAARTVNGGQVPTGAPD